MAEGIGGRSEIESRQVRTRLGEPGLIIKDKILWQWCAWHINMNNSIIKFLPSWGIVVSQNIYWDQESIRSSHQMFFTPWILTCCRRIAFLISRWSALTREIVNSYQIEIMFKLWKWPFIHNPNYVLPTLLMGGGTKFPISLCSSRIVPANSKSSLKVFQVVKNQ